MSSVSSPGSTWGTTPTPIKLAPCAERSIALACQGGHAGSPLAWLTLVQLAFAEADYPAMQRLCEQARDVADVRGTKSAHALP